ncbi:MAG: hypothetical protein AAF799_10480 [Myxococcota bacterium]
MLLPSRKVSIASRLAPLVFGSVLAVVASVAGAAPDAPPTQRIEGLWLDAAGTSGYVDTSPTLLDEATRFHFGSQSCGRRHRLGAETLELLRGALVHGQSVRIDAAPSSEAEGSPLCITGVAVFAPESS